MKFRKSKNASINESVYINDIYHIELLPMAEQQRFELWLRSPPLTVFKTVPLNRLGTAPARA